jgi:hypothetical protein
LVPVWTRVAELPNGPACVAVRVCPVEMPPIGPTATWPLYVRERN